MNLKNLRYNEYPSRKIYYGYGIKNITSIPIDVIYDEESLTNLHYDLLDSVDHCAWFTKFSLDECLEKMKNII